MPELTGTGRPMLTMGSGEPVVLLHGGGLAAAMWRPLMIKLRERYLTMAPELPRAGRDATPEAMRAMNEAVIDETIERGGGPVHLVGHSYGGGLALRATLRRPDRIASLSLLEPTLPALLRAAGETEALENLLAWRRELDRAVPLEAARNFISYLGGPDFWRWLPPAAREGVAGWLGESVGPAWDHFYEEETIDLAAVGTVAVPTLIVSGDASPLPCRRTAEVLASSIPHAIHKRLTGGVGHMAPITHPQLVNPEIIAHLGAGR